VALEVMGWAELAGQTLRQVDVTVRSRDFAVMNTPFIQAQISMDLSVRGSLQEMAATGTVTVPRLRVEVDKIPGTGQKNVQPWELTVQGMYGPGPGAVGNGEDGAPRALQIDVPRAARTTYREAYTAQRVDPWPRDGDGDQW
jgi:hypothetical protein